MAFHPILGQLSGGGGKELPTLPANPTLNDVAERINDIVGQLNNQNKDIIATETVIVPMVGLDVVVTAPHNLGYIPRVEAYLNGVNITVNGTSFKNVDIALPTYLAESVPGMGGGGGSSVIAFSSWLDFFVDDTNVYIHTINPSVVFIPSGLPVTYSLSREPSRGAT